MIQILENLISNAIKFSPRGKNIRIKVGKYDRIVRIEVMDQGPGIRKEDMDRLFKKFQRLSARPTGDEDSTGLGLSIVKKFVDSMGGEVKCESTFGEGANFIVEFDSHDPEEA
jgi:signal transduction histidine kinase